MAKRNIECPDCKGKGFIIEDEFDENGEYAGCAEVKCTYCNGTGEVDYDENYWNRPKSRGKLFTSW